ncbi:signal transduction histidine kinase [Motilibacter peucedani]|uniref:histidine kinase n=1 Tax=Motilibacter peucedani TaxID=598650 RepID=A0A420XND1_9ACTN|nr:HAMP domain-containing sensor histidine kinase [Motilibacter peucedani]RKS72775.1 signal transduction histidine kinase [Motilibacter peucedani]
MSLGPDTRVLVVAAACSLLLGGALLLVFRALRRLPIGVSLAGAVLTAVLSVVAGTAVASHEMYLTAGALHVVVMIAVVAGLGAAVVGLLLAREVARDVREAQRHAASLAEARAYSPGRRSRTAELADLSDELDRTAARLAEATERERSLERSRRELVAWVSHDLRTPLAGLRAVVEALEDGVGADPAVQLKTVRTEVDRLTGMIDDLFELSRVQSGARSGRRERVRVHDLVSDAIAGGRPVAEARGVELVGAAGEQLVLEGDVSALQRALDNLVGNAVRHTGSGGTVQVTARRAGGEVLLEVSDGCGGIAPADLDRVFDTGWQADASRSPGGRGGAGLGLAIVRGITEAHGGTATVENAGEGCRFRLALPAS